MDQPVSAAIQTGSSLTARDSTSWHVTALQRVYGHSCVYHRTIEHILQHKSHQAMLQHMWGGSTSSSSGLHAVLSNITQSTMLPLHVHAAGPIIPTG
jgi:hypothetical protein